MSADNGLSPDRIQVIIWTDGVLLIESLRITSERIQNSYSSIQGNALENVVWKMAAIFSRPQCVKELWWWKAIFIWMQMFLLSLLLFVANFITLSYMS